ncbi:recombinase family protein [Pseudomonas asiatica]|nr:recombinase family protein [Pseudomonas asiatica]WJM56264.1 recombinase family protein [Pseudomonas asiatica]
MDVVAYIRVSTGKQEASGLGLEAQLDYIHTAAQQQGWNIVATYSDTISGSVAPQERPQMALALAHGLPIVAAKIDRISRDVAHMATLMKTHTLKIATMPTADNFQLHLFAALAEQERTFIRQRVKDALGALQERADKGCVESQAKINRRSEALQKGRKGNVQVMNEVKEKKADTHKAKLLPYVLAALYKGASTLQALADELNTQGLHTARGGEWVPTTVRRLMLSLEVSFNKG